MWVNAEGWQKHSSVNIWCSSQWRSGPLLWPFTSGFGLSELGGGTFYRRHQEAVLHQRVQVPGAAGRSVLAPVFITQCRSNCDSLLVSLQGSGSVPLALRPAWRTETITWVWDRWSPVPHGTVTSWSCSTPVDRPVPTKAGTGPASSASNVTKIKLWDFLIVLFLGNFFVF